jgi:hypothetical protein
MVSSSSTGNSVSITASIISEISADCFSVKTDISPDL